jgi:hypothetical protein
MCVPKNLVTTSPSSATHPPNMLSHVNLYIALQWYLKSLGKFVDLLDTASRISVETRVALRDAKSIVDAHIQGYDGGTINEVTYQPPCGDAECGPRWAFTPSQESDFSFCFHGNYLGSSLISSCTVYIGTVSFGTTYFNDDIHGQHTNPESEPTKHRLQRGQITPVTYSKSERRQFTRQQRTRQKTSKHRR